MPPFTGGLTGYFSYDYLNYSEPTVRRETEDTEPDTTGRKWNWLS